MGGNIGTSNNYLVNFSGRFLSKNRKFLQSDRVTDFQDTAAPLSLVKPPSTQEIVEPHVVLYFRVLSIPSSFSQTKHDYSESYLFTLLLTKHRQFVAMSTKISRSFTHRTCLDHYGQKIAKLTLSCTGFNSTSLCYTSRLDEGRN